MRNFMVRLVIVKPVVLHVLIMNVSERVKYTECK
jgi:hypothetical protein